MNKKKLKLLLTKNIESTISHLDDLISDELELFDELILAKSRLSDLQRKINRGVIPPIEENIEMNKIRGSVIHIINSVDFSVPAENNNNSELTESDLEEIQLITDEEKDEIDLGLFEIEELVLSYSNELTITLNRMTNDINEMGEMVKQDAEKLTRLNKSASKSNRVLVKKILSNTSKAMDVYSKRLEIEIPNFKSNSEASVNYSIKYISKIYEFKISTKENEIIEFASATKELLDSTLNSRNSLLGMYESIKETPELTSEYIKAKKKVLSELDKLFVDYNKYLENLNVLNENIETIQLELKN